jgi:hypothetical protein
MAKLLSKASMVVEKGDRKYELLMEQGSPCGEAFDALFELMNDVLKIAGDKAEQAGKSLKDANKSEEAPAESAEENK